MDNFSFQIHQSDEESMPPGREGNLRAERERIFLFNNANPTYPSSSHSFRVGWSGQNVIIGHGQTCAESLTAHLLMGWLEKELNFSGIQLLVYWKLCYPPQKVIVNVVDGLCVKCSVQGVNYWTFRLSLTLVFSSLLYLDLFLEGCRPHLDYH